MGPVAWPTSRVAGSERTHRFEYPAAMDARGFARCGPGHDVWFLLRHHVAPEATRLWPWDHANRSEPAGHHAAYSLLEFAHWGVAQGRRGRNGARQASSTVGLPFRRNS